MDIELKERFERYFNGDLTLEEEKELFAWLKTSPENLAVFREFKAQWKKGFKPSAEMTASFRKMCDIAISEEKARRRRRATAWLSAAASVAAVAITLFFADKSNYDRQLVSLTVPQGNISKIELSDGSTVWVNAGSTLTYPQKFRKFKRCVELNGEGYFEIAHNPRCPFIVKTSECDFKVLGTKFNITAYEEDGATTAVLIEGSLKFTSGKFSYTMDPGDMITHTPERTSREKVEPKQYSGWTESKITFDQIALPVLLRRVERLFDVKICLDSENFDFRTLRASFSKDDSVDYILKTVCGVFPLRYYCEDGVWHLVDRHSTQNSI